MNNIEDEVSWSNLPIINEVSSYLTKSEIIILSQTCKYYRLKLSDRIFYKVELFNQVYWNFRKANNLKLSGRKLKLLICNKMIEDLACKVKFIRKVVLTSRINAKFANLFFSKFKYCRAIIIDCKYDYRLSVIYTILKHLKYLEVLFMESVIENSREKSLPPPSFKLPQTLKSIYVFPCLLEKNYIPPITQINFKIYKSLINWQITGNYDIDRFCSQQRNIIHLYLRDIPFIDPHKFQLILQNNYHIKTLVYEAEFWSTEKFNNVLSIPNLKKLQIINYSFDQAELTSFDLIINKTIKTLIIEHETPVIIIESLLNSLKSLKDIIFVSWNFDELLRVNWSNYIGRFSSITFGFSYWIEAHVIGDQFDCLKPDTKIFFDNSLDKIINYDLTI